MKIGKVLLEQGGQMMMHHAEYSMNSGMGRINSEAVEDYEEAKAIAHDEFSIEGQEIYPGVWAGWHFNDAEISDEADEDGPYQYTELTGDVVIITSEELSTDHPIFQKIERMVNSEAESVMSDAQYDHRDQKEYQRDPYAYYGVKRSDF